MSTMKPMYGIPANIRYGISMLERFEDDDEMLQSALKEVKELFNEHAGKLSEIQVRENMTYIENLEDYLNMMFDVYEKMGFEVPRKKDNEETDNDLYLKTQHFCRHVFKDHEYAMAKQVYVCCLAMRVVKIAKEEISKYLPEILDGVGVDDKKMLQKVDSSINK